MKILIVYNAHRFGGGSDAVAKRTAELLTQAGHTVSVFTRSSKGLSGLRGSLHAFLCGLYSPRVIRDFNRVLTDFQPDVVHAHEVYPLITPWIFKACKKRSIPVVMTCHDYRLSCPIATHFRRGQLCFECSDGHELCCVRHNCCSANLKSLAYALRNFTARLFHLFFDVNLFLTPSEKAKEILCQHAGLPPDRVVAVGNPVSAGSAGYDEFVFGDYVAYAGRFEPEKGFEWLVETLAGIGIPLKVAGDASGYFALGKTIPEQTEFAGYLDREGIRQFYRQARILVVPSLGHETFGLVVAEALSCGTPVVVTNLGALAEVAGSGGVVVPSGDIAALRAAICNLWNDEELCRTMAVAGREHVKRYSDKAYVENLMGAYGRVVKVEGWRG